MPRITSKLQITIPKRLAEQVGLAPGDEVEFLAAGDGIRMVPAGKSKVGGLSTAERLRLFRAATERQQARDKARPVERSSALRAGAAGRGRSSTPVPSLVDTNILVYRVDPRDPAKQRRATALLEAGIADRSLILAHQSVIEFVAAASRPSAGREIRRCCLSPRPWSKPSNSLPSSTCCTRRGTCW